MSRDLTSEEFADYASVLSALSKERARAEAAEAKLDDLKPLRHALEHSVSTTIHRGVVAERDKQRGMFLDAERQCEILMQQRDAAVARVADLKMALGDGAGWFDRYRSAAAERDAAVALGKRLAAAMEILERSTMIEAARKRTPQMGDRNSGAWYGCLQVLADARKAGWLT